MTESLIAIKRSGVSGNPAKLRVGELAYSWANVEGGNRLYIGTGEERDGNATNHVVIGGKYFTDLLSSTAGTLTPNTAIVVGADKKINELITDHLHSDANLTIEGIKTIVKNLYIGDENTSIEKFVKDNITSAELHLTAGAGISITGDDTHNQTIAITDTGVTAKAYGSATKIPVITVDAQGRITTASEEQISTSLNLGDGAEGAGTVDLLGGKLEIAKSDGITVALEGSKFTIGTDATVVKTAGDQTVNGTKTFGAIPKVTAEQTLKTATEGEIAKASAVLEELTYTDESPNGATVTVGGIKKGDKVSAKTYRELIDLLLHPYVAPSGVGLSLNINGGTFEKGTTQQVSSGTVRWTLGSQKINKAEILVSNVVKGSAVPSSASATSTAITLDNAMDIKDNTSFTARVTDTTSSYNGGNVSFNFVYPYYHGVMDKREVESADVVALTKVVQAKGNKTFTYTSTNKYMVIAYPSSYGALKSILDPNKFENVNGFELKTVQVTGLDGTSQEYNVYVANDRSNVSGYNMTFNY